MIQTLRLFKALPILDSKKGNEKPFSKSLLNETINRGFFFSQELSNSYTEDELRKMIPTVSKIMGLTPTQMNASFHKSWKKVKDAPFAQLLFEQLVHYITTYGFEAFGVYDSSTVYIPDEALDIPNVNLKKVKLSIVRGYTLDELKQKVLDILSLGIALKDETMEDIMKVIKMTGFEQEDLKQVANKEVMIMLCDKFNLLPENPIEFLRYVIYTSTNTTLLIKNDMLINLIKESKHGDTYKIFNRYNELFGYDKLASIFLRFKPLFLAFKSHNGMAPIINQLRRYAKKYHKPMKEDFLNSITSYIRQGKEIDTDRLLNALEKVNLPRKIRLAQALDFYTKPSESILYQVRNGKAYAMENRPIYDMKTLVDVYNFVVASISDHVKKNVEGKSIFIPGNIVYNFPASEKQFLGNFPAGSYVQVPGHLIVGVHWENQGSHRIDLDFSLLDRFGGKIGWDSQYRNKERTVLFSGDMTDAPLPNGATELHYVSSKSAFIGTMNLNYYNFDEDVPVPYKFFVASEKVTRFSRDYMVSPNSIVFSLDKVIDIHQQIIGMVVVSEHFSRFYFSDFNMGGGISARNSDANIHAINFLLHKFEVGPNLADVLYQAGANLVSKPDDAEIDLSPQNLEKDTILKLIY